MQAVLIKRQARRLPGTQAIDLEMLQCPRYQGNKRMDSLRIRRIPHDVPFFNRKEERTTRQAFPEQLGSIHQSRQPVKVRESREGCLMREDQL
jgi:hypothetical protein